MTVEEQTKALEDESAAVNKEIKQALLDIRAVLMEITSPLRQNGKAAGTVPSESAGKEGTRMETELEKRLNALEDDFKLIKGEIRSTVMNVRDVITEFKAPPSVEEVEVSDPVKSDASPPANDNKQLPPNPDMAPRQEAEARSAPSAANGQPSFQEEEMRPSFMPANPARNRPPVNKDELPEPPTFGEEPPELESGPESGQERTESEDKRPLRPAGEKPLKNERPFPAGGPAGLSEVNPLVNLISWVARTKRELGKERLETLLDVYGMSAPLSNEIRSTILNLSEIIQDETLETARPADLARRTREGLTAIFENYTGESKLPEGLKEAAYRFLDGLNLPPEAGMSAVWGRLILELHGILAGNETLFSTYKARSLENKPAAENSQEQGEEEPPFKLKLVLPGSGGREKEFVLNLSPNGHDGNGHNGNGNRNK